MFAHLRLEFIKIMKQKKNHIDGYYSENILDKIGFEKGMAQKVLEITNNEHLFNIFKMSVTETFLKANSNE